VRSTPDSSIRVITAVTDPFSCILLIGQLAYMRQAGFDVCFVTAESEVARTFAAAEGVRFRPLSMRREISLLRDLRTLVSAIRLIREERPHVVNAGTPKAGLVLMLASWFCRVPTRIYTLRGLRFESERGLRRLILRAAERLACRVATRVVCVSHSVRDLVVADRISEKSKTAVIGAGSSNGLDLARFSRATVGAARIAELRRMHGIAGTDFIIGFIGRLVPRKGVCELIEAWRTLREQIPSSKLLLVGPLEDAQPLPAGTLEAVADDPRVIRTGFVRNVEEYLCLMNVFVFPAHWEGFGNVLLQASACEVPIVATRVTGVRDAVKDGVSGVLVEKGDVNAIIREVSRYYSMPELAKEYGQRGSAWVREHFRPEPIWNGLASLYRASPAEDSRMPLHFAGIGPQRTATTWLYEMLSRHPSIAFPGGVKETKFFDERFQKGLAWFERHFADAAPGQIRGEIAPTYFDDDAARARLKRAFPDLKVIVNLRNPVDRAFSLYRLELMKGRVSGGFKEAAAKNSRIITSGHYARYCPRWEAEFGRDRVLYLVHEDISADPAAVLDCVYDFIGVPRVAMPSLVDERFSMTDVPRHPPLARIFSRTATFLRSHRAHWLVNLGKKAGLRAIYGGGRAQPLTAELRENLLQVFEPDIRWVEERTGRVFPQWRTVHDAD
jgi:glycosyltransferase involved in cell wall biosynthesis